MTEAWETLGSTGRISLLDPSTPARSAQAADLRRQNISSIMLAIMRSSPIARGELARITGMATGTVTKLTAMLGEAGLLRELSVNAAERNPGRPRVPLVVDDRDFRVVGVHFGYLRTSLCLLDLTGALVAETHLNHRGRGFDGLVAQAIEGIENLIAGQDHTVLERVQEIFHRDFCLRRSMTTTVT